MDKVLLALMSVSMLSACTLNNQDEYDADHKAYTECIENEPSMDDCVYDYVKYLPEDIQEEMEL